jgi:N-acetylglucosamine-6-phosphate deacetylase
MPDGEYESAGMPVTLKNGKATLTNGGSLAGSTITLLQGLRLAVSLGVPLNKAINAATLNCAKAIGMEGKIGAIALGAYADFVLLNDELELQKVYIGGNRVLI